MKKYIFCLFIILKSVSLCGMISESQTKLKELKKNTVANKSAVEQLTTANKIRLCLVLGFFGTMAGLKLSSSAMDTMNIDPCQETKEAENACFLRFMLLFGGATAGYKVALVPLYAAMKTKSMFDYYSLHRGDFSFHTLRVASFIGAIMAIMTYSCT